MIKIFNHPSPRSYISCSPFKVNYLKKATSVSIPSAVLDIRRHRNRARKIFPLISSPSCILHLSVILHRNTQFMGF